MTKQNLSKRSRIILIAVAVLLLISVSGGVLARYISQNRQRAEMESAGFHISSDYLEETTASYLLPNWGLGFDVQLYNYEKLNLANTAEMDITYTVAVENGVLTSVKDGGNDVTAAGGSYSFPQTSNTQLLHIAPQGPGQVTVTVTTTAPYRKTLSAVFTTTSERLPSYVFESVDGDVAKLTIYSNDYSGNVTVNWTPATCSPDNDNDRMASWTDADHSGALALEAHSTYELLFFKHGEITPGSGNNTTTISIG